MPVRMIPVEALEDKARMGYLNRSIAAIEGHTHRKRTPRPVKHGTEYAYGRRLCRCDVCRAAHNKRDREYRKRQKSWPKSAHGRNTTYLTGCRCDLCREAHAELERVRRQRAKAKKREPRLEYYRARYQAKKAEAFHAL